MTNYNTGGDNNTFERDDSYDSKELQPGRRLGERGNYKIVRKLGQGGMGEVWLAEEIEGGKVLRSVVCKILPGDVQSNAREWRKIETVFNLTKDLNHTNICPLYGMKSDPVFGWFYVMGYADGQTLRAWFDDQPNADDGLPLDQVLPILRPIASALDYAHQNKVIHRDVKPENIMFRMLNGVRVPWLLDFGIAAQIHETLTRTMSASQSSGTPHYMSPEQVTGDPQDARTDQYALAVIAYELLSGRTPFGGMLSVLFEQIRTKVPTPIPQLTQSVNSALQKALSKKPSDRFETCAEFVNALCPSAVPPKPPVPPVPPVPPKPPVPPTEKKEQNTNSTHYEDLLDANLSKLRQEQAEAQAKKDAIRAEKEARRIVKREELKNAGIIRKFFHSFPLFLLYAVPVQVPQIIWSAISFHDDDCQQTILLTSFVAFALACAITSLFLHFQKRDLRKNYCGAVAGGIVAAFTFVGQILANWILAWMDSYPDEMVCRMYGFGCIACFLGLVVSFCHHRQFFSMKQIPFHKLRVPAVILLVVMFAYQMHYEDTVRELRHDCIYWNYLYYDIVNSDSDLARIGRMTNLESLKLIYCDGITSLGRERLQEALPNCEFKKY